MERNDYFEKLKENFLRDEALCKRCGRCCGAFDGDPCSQLMQLGDGQYLCKVYENRIGSQVTVSGKHFNCVPVIRNRSFADSYPDCPYFA